MKNSNDSFFSPKRLVFANGMPEAPGGPEPLPTQPPSPVEGPKTPEDIAKDAQSKAEKMQQGEAVIGSVETQPAKLEAGEFINKSGNVVTDRVQGAVTAGIINHLNVSPDDAAAIAGGESLEFNVPVRVAGAPQATMYHFDVKKNAATGKVDTTLTSVG